MSNGRLVAVWLVLVMGILGLAWRLYQLQIVQTQELQKRARQQQTTSIRPYIPRRAIVDSNGNVLATDRFYQARSRLSSAANCSIVEVQWIKLLRRCDRKKSIFLLNVVAEMLQW